MAIVQLPDDGKSAPILIEVGEVGDADLQGFYESVDTRGIMDKTVTKLTRQLYAEAIGLACTCARETSQRLAAMDDGARPAEFEVQFAMNVDAKVGAKIVEAGSAAQVLVRMQWNGGVNA